MRHLAFLLILFFGFQIAKGQGFERSFPLDTVDAEVKSIRLIDQNRIELDFLRCWSGPGLDGCREFKAWYYSDKDSLGARQNYSETAFAGAFDQLLIKDNLWFTYGNDFTSCGGRCFLNIRVLNPGNQNYRVPSTWDFRFISGAYNFLYLRDTIFAYHGQEACVENTSPFDNNDTLYYYYLDLKTGQVHYLDTVALGFPMYTPGSLLHDQTTGQNILFYDSLRVYLSPNMNQPDSIVVDTSIWGTYTWSGPRGNFNRHYQGFTYATGRYRAVAQCKDWHSVFDTLDSYRIDYYTDWFNQSNSISFPAVPEYPRFDETQGILMNRSSDSVITYGIIPKDKSSQSLELYRLVNNQIRNHVYYVSPPGKNYKYTAVESDADGNFYIAANLQKRGNRSYWFYDANDWGDYNVTLIKVDKNGNSRDYSQGESFSLQMLQGENRSPAIIFKYQDPSKLMSYRIIDSAGRTYAMGQAYSGEVIDISAIKFGLYFFSLWDEKDRYIGQQSFLKSN